ncbi:MAG TPA: cysteine--tRNA ligase [Alphaproteobacteria bacterium]|nr:cysteine--tRNA ligase [Alphaproteobacteria bacterium]
MADIYLTNSLTRKKEKFVPLRQAQGKLPIEVGMYTCGPTVYDYQHIGNFRTMMMADLFHRLFKFNGFNVTTIRNVTDIDDKIIRNASAQNIPIEEYTEKFTKIYFSDLEKLNILPVSVNPKATEYVEQMVEYIKVLIDKDFAYVEDDGSVYFDISKFTEYGKLSHLDKSGLKSGTRILSDEYTKDSVQDFALWKATKEGEIASYNSPWGKGRPGWHIECSVMSQKQLGDSFDIHAGGRDLMFPHHENEIAQSESKTGKPFVKYWLHGEMLQIDGKKMSKSLKNFYLLKDLEEKGFEPLAYRYLVLTAHYRDFLNFTWASLEAAQNGLNNLRSQIANLKSEKTRTVLSKEKNDKVDGFRNSFIQAVNDDLNTSKGLAVLWEMLKSNIPSQDKYDLAMSFDEVLGLDLSAISNLQLPISNEVQELMNKREKLRKEKKFEEADKIRKEIEDLGFKVNDTSL